MSKQYSKEFKENAVRYFYDHSDLEITKCAKNLGVSKSALSTWKREFEGNHSEVPTRGRGNYESDEAKEKIIEIYEDSHQNYGSPKITRILQQNGETISDITYIWTMSGFVYLTSIMDLYSRKIISWVLSETLETRWVIEAVRKAQNMRQVKEPLILHTDRGVQYVSNAYREVTQGMQRSYSKKAYPWDNACIESFHAILKREWINRFKIFDYNHAYRLIFEYIETFYNTVRIHSHCDYKSPNEHEKKYWKENTKSQTKVS